MADQGIWAYQRTAGALLVAAILPLALGVFLFFKRNGLQGGLPLRPGLLVWERGAILAAVVLTALGFMLLELAFHGSRGNGLGRLGASAFFFAAVLLVVAEGLGLSGSGGQPYPLIVAYVVLALLGQAALGGAILLSGLLPAWIGWAAIAWNLGWLVVLPLATRHDMYFPVLHHVTPLLIAVGLLGKG